MGGFQSQFVFDVTFPYILAVGNLWFAIQDEPEWAGFSSTAELLLRLRQIDGFQLAAE
jgi:hypothetical protein